MLKERNSSIVSLSGLRRIEYSIMFSPLMFTGESDSDFHFYRNGGGSHSSSVACVGALIMILAVIVWLNIRTKDWEENKCRSDSKSRRAELG